MKTAVRAIFLILIMLTMGLKRYNPAYQIEITKEQLVAFVQEAQCFIKIYGKEEALREFNDQKGMFFRGELYIHAADFNCRVLAHGRDSSIKGKSFEKLVDPDNIKICQDKVKILEKNASGWLKYKFYHPITHRLEHKLTYFERVGNEDWYISSGIYTDED
jgi:hypothetical protein